MIKALDQDTGEGGFSPGSDTEVDVVLGYHSDCTITGCLFKSYAGVQPPSY